MAVLRIQPNLAQNANFLLARGNAYRLASRMHNALADLQKAYQLKPVLIQKAGFRNTFIEAHNLSLKQKDEELNKAEEKILRLQNEVVSLKEQSSLL